VCVPIHVGIIMEHAIAEQVVSEALEYTMRCIKQTVDQCPQFTDVKHVQQQEIKVCLCL
jgi:hypothetical protein